MASGPVAPLAAAGCFLLAAAAYALRWRYAPWVAGAGAAILGGAVVARGWIASRWPLINEYEFALAFALGTALAASILSARQGHPEPAEAEQDPGSGGAWAAFGAAMVIAAALVAYARLGVPQAKRLVQPLPPALDSIWLPLHVGVAALAYGALAVAGAAGLGWLVRESGRAEVERVQERAIAIGYPLLTLSIVLGMVWAQVAWGRYWGWDLKEVWTLILWLAYALYYHLRRRQRWKGRRLAWLAVAGLGLVLFTFLGIDWLARAVGLESLYL